MQGVEITVFDPDTSRTERAARKLRVLLQSKGISACVHEVTCYLEISRQGLKDKTPVLLVNGDYYQCKNLDEPLLHRFVDRLAEVHNQ
jgi:hypothetical protein